MPLPDVQSTLGRSGVAGGERSVERASRVAGDTLFVVIVGVAIFPVVFPLDLDPAQEPTLAFVTLPRVFRLMPGGRLFA